VGRPAIVVRIRQVLHLLAAQDVAAETVLTFDDAWSERSSGSARLLADLRDGRTARSSRSRV
jgi:hypothetical protein